MEKGESTNIFIREFEDYFIITHIDKVMKKGENTNIFK